MSKKQHSFSSVISVNPYKGDYLSSISTVLAKENSPRYLKTQYVISYLNAHDFINSNVSISKNIPDEDIRDAITNKVYDELALDQAIEYDIGFFETFSKVDNENRTFQTFIVDPLTIVETYKNVVEEIKYIDTIIPSPLLIKSLYSKNIIENGGVHCFLYIQEHDATITVYNEKEFLYTKSIHNSLFEMHERFCEFFGEKISYESFIDFISNQNFKDTKSEYKKYVFKMYKEMFSNVNDILTYVKRAYELEKIEHLYIGMQIPTLSKIYEIAEYELNIKSSDFNFDYGFEKSDIYIDQLHFLMHVYTTLESADKYEVNFSLFPRPPKFIKRESGKLLMLMLASFFISFAYPITYWVLIYAQSMQYQLMEKKYEEIHNTKITREVSIKTKKAQKAKSDALLAEETKEYIDKKNTLIKIHKVKVDYPMKSKLLSILTKDLNMFGVQIDSISYNQKNNTKKFILNLVSDKESKITKLVKYLTKIHRNKFHFSLEHIYLDEKEKKYLSELKVNIL